MNISSADIKVSSVPIFASLRSTNLEKNYSAVLVIPDLYDRAYVREMVNMLINSLGFKQVCAQQVIDLPFSPLRES